MRVPTESRKYTVKEEAGEITGVLTSFSPKLPLPSLNMYYRFFTLLGR